jgi:hypothetical protein
MSTCSQGRRAAVEVDAPVNSPILRQADGLLKVAKNETRKRSRFLKVAI